MASLLEYYPSCIDVDLDLHGSMILSLKVGLLTRRTDTIITRDDTRAVAWILLLFILSITRTEVNGLEDVYCSSL